MTVFDPSVFHQLKGFCDGRFICGALARAWFIYIYTSTEMYLYIYVYVCVSFLCMVRTVMSTAETMFSFVCFILLLARVGMDVHGFWVRENKLRLSALMKPYFPPP